MPDEPIDDLFATLSRRDAPERVAALARTALSGRASSELDALLGRVAAMGARGRFGWSSMASTFRRPDPMDAQLARAEELARLFLDETLGDVDDAEEISAFIDAFSALIGKPRGANDFLVDRLNRSERRARGLTLSRRRYDKLWRLATRLEDRLARLRAAEDFAALTLISKAGLATDIDRASLDGRPWTASFVAYYAARMKRRSVFTAEAQDRAFDPVSAALLDGCARHEDAAWSAIARVFPRDDVLERLSDAEKGALLGRWTGVLTDLAGRLEDVHRRSSIDIDTMIVRRGNDSSTWNTLAGAWNRARDHWIALLHTLGLQASLAAMTPGKVMRLMAADVAWMHGAVSDGLHPDTEVWRALPKPWEVMTGRAVCTRAMVEEACREHLVDPVASGWTAPRSRRKIAALKPTPELVHGVEVDNPFYAKLLRGLGVYSGKPVDLTPERVRRMLGDA